MKKKIAITGGIGSGKTTVVQILNEMGYTTFSCDGLYQEIIRRKSYVFEIEKRFPQAVVNGRIDRAKLAQIIFNDEGKRKELNQIAHPLIMQELLERMEKEKSDLVFAEVPLLFEGNFQNLFDAVIVVTRQREDRIASIIQRDGGTREDIVRKIDSQWNYDTDRDFPANHIILLSNDYSKKDLSIQIQNAIKRLS